MNRLVPAQEQNGGGNFKSSRATTGGYSYMECCAKSGAMVFVQLKFEVFE